jgi:hypothetical protein
MKLVFIVYFLIQVTYLLYILLGTRSRIHSSGTFTNEKRNVIDVHAPNEEGGNWL